MISRRVWERTLWGIAGVGSAAAIVGARMAMPTSAAPVPVIWSAPSSATVVVPESLDTFARAVVQADLFRLDRAPAPVPYQVAAGQGSPTPPPAPAKPPLAVAGLIGGPPWVAILEGIPGQAGSILAHAGDVFGPLRVRKIDRNGVVITGMDTTWNLTLKHPWH